MENQYITIAIQTRERAEKIVKKAKEKGIDCQLEIPELTGDSKEEKIKIRVKISDIEKALDITEEIDKVYGKEIIDVPREDIHINKILIPVVFKSYSEKGPFLALSLANKLKAEVHLFHTYFNPFTNPLSYTDDMKTSGYFDNNVSSIEDHSIEKMQQLINQLHKKCEKNNFKDVILDYTVTGGNLFNELERKSKIYEPDMLVLGTKGKNKKNSSLFPGVFN